MTTRPVEPATVVVVGSANADLLARTTVHPAPGETVLGRDLQVLPGGKGANQAVAAARLGARVAFVGAVGDDEFAQAATSGLRDAGVDLSGLVVVPGGTGVAVVTVAADGENAIVVVPGANAAVDAAQVRRHADLLAAAAVVVLQGEIPRDGIEEAARLAGGRVVVNLAPVIDVDAAILRRADPLVVNEHEAHGALGLLERGAPAAGAELTDEDVVGALRRLGVPSVVLTRGAQGALVAGPGVDGVVVVSSPRVDAVDTTGAGDAFVGALAGELAWGRGLVDAARLAARVGAFAVRGSGAQPSYPRVGDELP
ncbi:MULTISPECIES: ribokinase [unclassified Isoptericola]|uniref:ribokinase n=1 Tax=unclassified Isoptericola TaxID=2623355 RepID=UPI00365CDE37